MPLKPEAGTDFASVLNSAMRQPETMSDFGKDLPDGFPMPHQDGHRVIDTSEDGIPGLVAYDFKIHRRVFTIFRPWDACARCGADMASGAATLPAAGDYECPHTLSSEYEEIVNDILAGKMVFGSEQEITQKDGSVLVSLRWYEKLPRKKAAPKPGVGGVVEEPPI